MNETEWDGGATLWDVDVQGPGTRTIWDPLPTLLKIDQLAIVVGSSWMANVQPGRWKAEPER